MSSSSGLSGPDADLCRNLREVVDRSSSVAQFCRSAGFNRQQFNKYLAGTHMPSRRSMIRIAEHCGLGAQDFLLPHAAFLQKLDGRSGPAGSAQPTAHFLKLETLAKSSSTQLKPFLGTYFRYHNSSIYAGTVVRAVTVLYPHDDVIRYVCIEQMNLDGKHGRERYRFSYRGVCYLMGSRVFLSDYENKQYNEMTSTILMPQFRTPINYMFGILLGIASTTYGQAYAARVAFQRVSDNTRLSKDVLRSAALIAPTDPAIPASVKQYLEASPLLFADV